MDDKDIENVRSLRDLTQEDIESMTAKQAKVLRTKFGIEISSDEMLENAVREYDDIRRRIREIERNALGKIEDRNGGGPDDDGPGVV